MSGHQVKGIVVAGLSGGSGKSVVAVGLTAHLYKSGRRVIPFKKGPDYIDAGWLSQAAGRPCYNLDPFLMPPEVLRSSFERHAVQGDYAVIEGNRGLYDGVDAAGGYSTAELALLLDLPVLLVVNCGKTTRTVAALILGCRELDKRVRLAGVILNNIATSRQEAVIREAVEQYTSIPVVGTVPRQKKDIFPMRHLGVVPHQETESAAGAIDLLAGIVGRHFDTGRIEGLMGVASVAPPIPEPVNATVTVGIVRDRAFQFYYEENLEALREAGAKLVMIDALQARTLPDDLDALYIGGGFPETSAAELANNATFRESVRTAAERGMPIYAECGGLIFLGRSIMLEGREYPLAGVFPVTFGISSRPQAHGYSIFTADRDNPFYPPGTRIKGHEFRYSTIVGWDGRAEDLVLAVERGTGFMHGRDGLVRNNVLALYTHVLAPGAPEWARALVRRARLYHRQKEGGDGPAGNDCG
ncbi:MAG TPA: cobyrinate a,c-diamide synthase [Desulfobacteraceae bacterium]|nr:cobyrinate a,c-diamide synthase [Desulfobacteraceae bacterium]